MTFAARLRRGWDSHAHRLRVVAALGFLVAAFSLALFAFDSLAARQSTNAALAEFTKNGTHILHYENSDGHVLMAGRSPTGYLAILIVHPRHLLYRSYSTSIEVRCSGNGDPLDWSSMWVSDGVERGEVIVSSTFVGELQVRLTEVLLPYAGFGSPSATELRVHDMPVRWP